MHFAMNKKVIFIHLLNDFSGSTKVLSDILDVCDSNNIQNYLYINSGSEGFLCNKSKRQYLFYYKRFNNKFLTLISYSFSQLILFFKMFKYLRKDCIFYVNTMMPFGPALAAMIMRKKVIYHIHETSIQKNLKSFLRLVIGMTASHIIYVSDHLSKIEHFKGIDSKTIYNSVSKSIEIKAKNHKYVHSQSPFVVTMICSLKDYKGINELLMIAKLCKGNKVIIFELILNASDEEIKLYFDSKAVPNNISIFPKQHDLCPFYKKSQLVLNLSRIDEWIETFGLTILEAMTFGIPVIVPPVGGPKEIVRNKVDGFQISSYDIETIANKIIELSKNPLLCEQMSKNCVEQSAKFNFNNFERNIVEIINKNQNENK